MSSVEEMRNHCYIIAAVLAVFFTQGAVAEEFGFDDSGVETPVPAPRFEERDLLSVGRDKSPCEGIVGGCLVPATDNSQEAQKTAGESPVGGVTRVFDGDSSAAVKDGTAR